MNSGVFQQAKPQPASLSMPSPQASEPVWPELAGTISHLTHLLPAQGPITAFIHHNTLHAFEHLPFEQAVVEGGRIFRCHPYLREEQYREAFERGRIRAEDIEAVLLEDLGERAADLLGFLGTRFSLQEAILRHPLHDGPGADLEWVISESGALSEFRAGVPGPVRQRMIEDARRWTAGGNPASQAGNRKSGAIPAAIWTLSASEGTPAKETRGEDTGESFTLQLLWALCAEGAHKGAAAAPEAIDAVAEGTLSAGTSAPPDQWAGLLEELTGTHPDELVDELLIPFTAAFVDQGFVQWRLPNCELGFFRAFAELHAVQPLREVWQRGLGWKFTGMINSGVTPLESVADTLRLMGLGPADDVEPMLRRSLLALRGFAGMLWQLESRGDRVFRPAPAGTIVEYLAVRLILEKFAMRHLAREAGLSGDLARLGRELPVRMARTGRCYSPELRNAFRLFELGQLLGWLPSTLAGLNEAGWQMVLRELHAFPAIERRRIWHRAYERRYRNATLDALIVHGRRNRETAGEAAAIQRPGGMADERTGTRFQLVTCIDEREESFRRHLEEVEPACETLATAGFFRVPVYYRGAADAHYTPLCPVIIKPRHYVREEVAEDLRAKADRRSSARRTIGTITHRAHIGSRTFTGGWAGTVVLGTLATFPLVARILFPRLTARLRGWLGGFVKAPEATALRLERKAAQPGPEGDAIGFSVEEMANSVELLLRDIGLTARFARLVLVAGHGSSSLNNPHESAHDCGACGGGRGGPNARSFAMMANDPRVRAKIAANGLVIPDGTWFVGSYHNTCDDSFTCYDLERVPASHRDELRGALAAIDVARARSAHERCRRFETAPLDLTPAGALRHVENRVEDLSQVRPEYGHATNAVCLVGRREWSRGLYMDRRSFMQSYDSTQDGPGTPILERILQAVIPVCGGINLEYYFSFVDPTGYGCGTKLPHNITGLLGVMNGAASDLRTGLPWQMVEIHEPVRLLFVIETTPEAMLGIIERNPGIAQLCRGDWVQLVVFEPGTSTAQRFRAGQFEPYRLDEPSLPVVAGSMDWYRGKREHLGYASVGERYRKWAAADKEVG